MLKVYVRAEKKRENRAREMNACLNKVSFNDEGKKRENTHQDSDRRVCLTQIVKVIDKRFLYTFCVFFLSKRVITPAIKKAWHVEPPCVFSDSCIVLYQKIRLFLTPSPLLQAAL
jgi:hypothetical protein